MGQPKKTDKNPTDYKHGFNAEHYERLIRGSKKVKKLFIIWQLNKLSCR